MGDNYPGGKGGAGVWQRIISLMPRHENYFELFLGKSPIIRKKIAAPGLNVGVDCDPDVVAWWKHQRRPASSNLMVLQDDALRILSSEPVMADPSTLVYLDPPYLRKLRTRALYKFEFATPAQHRDLLKAINSLKCKVMISGYWSSLYEKHLLERDGWRAKSFRAATRGTPRQEFVWCNFPEGLELHDVRFVGADFRERERIKKKIERWYIRFAGMPAAERQGIRQALDAAEQSLAPEPKPAPPGTMMLPAASPETVIAAATTESGDADPLSDEEQLALFEDGDP